MSEETKIFTMLWRMFDEANESQSPGTVIGRYSSIIEDRLRNSRYSMSVDSLKLYTYEQLQDELDERDEDEPDNR